MTNKNLIQKIEDVCSYLKDPQQDSHTVVQSIIEILSNENPDYRDILAGVLKNNTKASISLLLRIPQEGKYALNVINMLIILSVYSEQYFHMYVDKGHKIDKKDMYGTTLFDYIITELEQPYPDIHSLVEGYFINSAELAQEYGINI